MRRRGADRPVVVTKRGNAPWSKGGGSSPLSLGQLGSYREEPEISAEGGSLSCDGTSRMIARVSSPESVRARGEIPWPTRLVSRVAPVQTATRSHVPRATSCWLRRSLSRRTSHCGQPQWRRAWPGRLRTRSRSMIGSCSPRREPRRGRRSRRGRTVPERCCAGAADQ